MAEDKKAKQPNPLAEAKNWEDRLRTEQEAIHKWNEAWGGLFKDNVPHEYDDRLNYLKSKLQEMPKVQALPKYGVAQPIKEFAMKDHKRKKMFYEDPLAWEDPSETVKKLGHH